MGEHPYQDLLLAELDRSEALHARLADDPPFRARRAELREWQAGRLARTHRDLLESKRFRAAAQFFLIDLYGPQDLGRHIAEIRRIVPLMAKVLPDSGLATVAHALELNVLSESLDEDVAEKLAPGAISADAYAHAYRAAGRREDRARQIDLIALLGGSLDKLTHIPLIGVTLKMMRKPAQLAGLGELQAFLERGYRAFGAMRGGAGQFVTTVVTRERAISEAVFSCDDAVLRNPAG